MTGTPCCLALLITAAAEGESRLTINNTFAPLLSIWSAIVANFALSPLAFWMSDSTPAALKASPRNLRSAVSQRADDAASGRITPTLAFVSGLAVAVALLLPLDDESSLPHAATVNARAAVTANAPRARCCIWNSPSSVLSADWRLSANSQYSQPKGRVSRPGRRGGAPSED